MFSYYHEMLDNIHDYIFGQYVECAKILIWLCSGIFARIV